MFVKIPFFSVSNYAFYTSELSICFSFSNFQDTKKITSIRLLDNKFKQSVYSFRLSKEIIKMDETKYRGKGASKEDKPYLCIDM